MYYRSHGSTHGHARHSAFSQMDHVQLEPFHQLNSFQHVLFNGRRAVILTLLTKNPILKVGIGKGIPYGLGNTKCTFGAQNAIQPLGCTWGLHSF